MSADSHLTTIRRFYEALDGHDVDALDSVLSPTYRCHLAGSAEPLDLEGFKQFARGFFAALPDLRHDVEEAIVEGDRAALRLRLRGTQRGDLMGVPATGKSVEMLALNVLHFADGTIAEHWIQADMFGLLHQLGAIAAPG